MAECHACGCADAREFCPRCGQPEWRGRYSVQRVIRDIAGVVVDADSRYARTVVQLFRRPGALAWDVLRGRTQPYIGPLRYLLFIATAATVFSLATGVDEASQRAITPPLGSGAEEVAQRINEFTLEWFQLILVGIVPMNALATWLLFRGWRLHYAEHLVLNAYVTAQQTLLWLPFTLVLLIPSPPVVAIATLLYAAASFTYQAWAYVAFFQASPLTTLARAVAAMVVGLVAYCAILAAAALPFMS